MTSFFVISNILGEITSTSVSKEPLQDYVNTLKDLEERNISWVYYGPYKLHVDVETLLPNQKSYSLDMSVQNGLKYVLENPSKYVYLAPKLVVDPIIRIYFWNGIEENPFHFSPPIRAGVPFYITHFLRRGSPYTETMTRRTLQMEAAGLIKGKFMPDAINIIAQSTRVNKSFDESQVKVVVTLESLHGYLWACFVMLISSIVAFIMELPAPAVIRLAGKFNQFRRHIFRRLRRPRRVNPVRRAWI